MTYRTPIDDMLLSLHHGAGFLSGVQAGHYNDYDPDFSASVIEEAGKFATAVLEPLNQSGDREGVKLTDKGVVTATGWADAYRRWTQDGWNAVSAPEEFGGQGLPWAIAFPVQEMWQSANMAFGLCPLLNQGAVEAILARTMRS